MFVAILILLLPSLVTCFSEGNIHLLEDEVAAAIQACKQSNGDFNQRSNRNNFNKNNQHSLVNSCANHSKSESNEMRSNSGKKNQNISKLPLNYTPSTYLDRFLRNMSKRIKRSKQISRKNDKSDQCLSQCVFANLHVVDKRGIPHEEKFWNKVEVTMKSQKSRHFLENNIRTCFHNLQSEADDNACSFSNKLGRCLMLRFDDRINRNRQNQTKKEI